MNVFSICAFALTALILILIVRQFRNDMALPVSVCVTVVLASASVIFMKPIVDFADGLLSFGNDGQYRDYVKIIMKSIGISLVSSCASDICRDAGESGMGNKIELIGKCAVLAGALPLLTSIVRLSEDILNV